MYPYESKYFGLGMQIPAGWEVQTWPDDVMEELAREAAAWVPSDPKSICFHATRNLVMARLYSPGNRAKSDAHIEFQACVQTDDCMLHGGDQPPLMNWNLNGLEILFQDEVLPGQPENRYFRFPRWKVSPNLWLYASIAATGKERFDYTLSIFETLAPLGAEPITGRNPLYACEPWNRSPTLFHLTGQLCENGSIYDLVFETEPSAEALTKNQMILRGEASVAVSEWTPLAFRRKSRIRKADCYYGTDSLYAPRIFSRRAIEFFQPHLKPGLVTLPCAVNGQPYYFISSAKCETCLDHAQSKIKRFQDGRIMKIDRYRFIQDAVSDPLVFGIPEEPMDIFVTASIPPLLTKAGLTGLACYPLDGNGREYTYPG